MTLINRARQTRNQIQAKWSVLFTYLISPIKKVGIKHQPIHYSTNHQLQTLPTTNYKLQTKS